MEHHFNVEIAEKYGILEAILLNNFYFWIKKNEANDKNFHEGRYWTYNSAKALHSLFPYASERKIRTAIKHLEDEGLVLTGNYNNSAYDRTMWYALTENATCILQNRQMEEAETSNESCENVTPIPDNKTDKNTEDNKYSDVPDYLLPAFMEWGEMRKKIRRPIPSEKTVTRALNKLYKLSDSKEKQIAIIEQSIDKNWLSFYPLHEDKIEQAPKVMDASEVLKEYEGYREKAVQMPDEIRTRLNEMF